MFLRKWRPNLTSFPLYHSNQLEVKTKMKSCAVLIIFALISAFNCETIVHEEGIPSGELIYRGNTGSKSAWEGSWQSKKVRYPTDVSIEEK